MANYRVSTNTNNSNKTTQDKKQKTKKRKKTRKQRKVNQLRQLRRDSLKISVNLQTSLAADTNPAEGQWLKEQLNVVKLRMFRVGTRRPTVSRTEGQYNNNNNNNNKVTGSK
jgi:hypothetical protein